MKIITKGTLPTPVIYTGTCKNCNCKVEAERSEHIAKWTPSNTKRSPIQVKCPTEGCTHDIRCSPSKK